MSGSARHVYWVHLQAGFGERAVRFSVAFETEVASVAEMARRLAERQVVEGFRLDLVDDGRGGKMIRGRRAFAFGVTGVVSLQDYDRPVWEPED